MAAGEFGSMTTLHDTIPDSTPEPVGWDTYASSPSVHFFLYRFVDMVDEFLVTTFQHCSPRSLYFNYVSKDVLGHSIIAHQCISVFWKY